MLRLLTLLFILATQLTYAAIYVQKDANGNITYSDTPSTNARIAEVPRVNTSPALQPPTPAPNKTTDKNAAATNTEKQPYTVFEITSPKDQETIQNQPVIPVTIKIEPAIQPGDSIMLFLDGRLTGTPQQSTQLQLTQVDRGLHQVFAVLINETKEVLKESNRVVINVHQNSSVTSPAMQPPPPPPPPRSS